ncbi:hypothetical protein, partial [Novacetimonas hansenii]|uniref:hypothetical protein n=1 Tax=Novacetimonas hansenii TaxID=436 RepID=UPI001C4D236D
KTDESQHAGIVQKLSDQALRKSAVAGATPNTEFSPVFSVNDCATAEDEHNNTVRRKQTFFMARCSCHACKKSFS